MAGYFDFGFVVDGCVVGGPGTVGDSIAFVTSARSWCAGTVDVPLGASTR